MPIKNVAFSIWWTMKEIKFLSGSEGLKHGFNYKKVTQNT